MCRDEEDSSFCYLEGFTLERQGKASDAINCYLNAAQRGYHYAFCSLGDIYYVGKGGVEQNFDKADEYYSKFIDPSNIPTDISGSTDVEREIIRQRIGKILKEKDSVCRPPSTVEPVRGQSSNGCATTGSSSGCYSSK